MRYTIDIDIEDNRPDPATIRQIVTIVASVAQWAFSGHPRVTYKEGNVYPPVKGVCPACDTEHLFLGAAGYVTCGYMRCPQPDLVSDLLMDGCGR